jgi:C4-dicarboxylate transporter, DctQ subunit
LVNAVEVSILVFCVAALGVLLMVNVVARTFFQSIYFAEEISMFLVMLTTFTGCQLRRPQGAAHPDGGLSGCDAAENGKNFIIIISRQRVRDGHHGLVLLGVPDERHEPGSYDPGLRLPRWTFYVIIPIGFGLACIQYIRTIFKNIIEKDPWQSPDQQSEYEDEEDRGRGAL